MSLLWILLFSILGSIGAIICAAIFLFLGERIQKRLIHCLVSYATGTLLTASILGLIAHALEKMPPFPILSTILTGIVIFFLLEKLVIWRHCHDNQCPVHGTAGPMILIGDLFHNATDGLVIAASFLSSIPIGIAIGISIIAHEIPQEVGDFAILLHSGYPKRKAIILNTLSSLSTVPAAILAYYALDVIRYAIPFVMAFSAASFLYIAMTDLYPELHKKQGIQSAIQQFLLMLAGIGTMILILQ
ncbi:MAG: ZIP family metal transporter [Candidatus Bathyarchaeota archaeon]|jgi:zinc and cadmium transporter